MTRVEALESALERVLDLFETDISGRRFYINGSVDGPDGTYDTDILVPWADCEMLEEITGILYDQSEAEPDES